MQAFEIERGGAADRDTGSWDLVPTRRGRVALALLLSAGLAACATRSTPDIAGGYVYANPKLERFYSNL